MAEDRSLLEFDSVEDGIEFLPDIAAVIRELPEITKLAGDIKEMKIGDTLRKKYFFESSRGQREVSVEVCLYDDQLDICIDSDTEICDALDKRWWEKFPED